ncbi:MAG: ring,2-phenylacetyl-CoA epoxidase subunit PaaA [Actinomycetota bacterium]|jgi:ring-1,2-phenylacetyl-CoA epoxidase subunit PaaA|nr:ring,2-phenylacetyl-CoA epoxidase subunit PaaA [Actinomycetota bacterium]
MTYEEKLAEFNARIDAGDKIEAEDWMPDDYRMGVLKFIEMHANSEIMGALPERECLPSAPTLQRKMSLCAKIQDEVGHAQLLYRVAEDLGKSRDTMFEDLVNGKSKFHNVFHYPVRHWGDVAIIGWLIDGAALVTQAALLDSSYAPYTRVLKRICAEEQLHLRHGEDITLELASGTDAQREMFQEALGRWWLAIIHFFGPRSNPDKDLLLKWKVKTRLNEDLRQEFLDRYVPRIVELGFTFPAPVPFHDEVSGHWLINDDDIDWQPLEAIKKNAGPETERRLGTRKSTYDSHRWVRDALAEPSIHAA